MEPNSTPERPGPNPAAEVHAPRAAVPVMDIVPPKPPEPGAVATEPTSPVAQAPTDSATSSVATEPSRPTAASTGNDGGVVQAPAEAGDDLLPSEVHDNGPVPEMLENAVAQPVKPPKSGNNTVAFAIAATVVIVLGLAIIAVIAYTSSK